MEPFKKYVICIMAFLIPFNFVTLCQFYSITSFLLFTKRHQETIKWEKRRFFVYIAVSVCHVISKKVKIHIFRHNCIFRHTCMYKQPILAKLHKTLLSMSYFCGFLCLLSPPCYSHVLAEWSNGLKKLIPPLKFNI